jgi:hypothetical protein
VYCWMLIIRAGYADAACLHAVARASPVSGPGVNSVALHASGAGTRSVFLLFCKLVVAKLRKWTTSSGSSSLSHSVRRTL